MIINKPDIIIKYNENKSVLISRLSQLIRDCNRSNVMSPSDSDELYEYIRSMVNQSYKIPTREGLLDYLSGYANILGSRLSDKVARIHSDTYRYYKGITDNDRRILNTSRLEDK